MGVVVVAALGLVSALIAIVLAPALSNGDPRLEIGIKISAVVLLASGVGQFGTELLLLRGQIKSYNFTRSMVLVLPPIAMIIAFATHTLTLRNAYTITLLGQIAAVTAGCFFAFGTIRKARRVAVPWDFSLRYWSTSALDAVGGRGDQVVLSALSQTSVLGVYSLAVTCASASAGLTQALNSLAYSALSRLEGQENKSYLRRRSLLGVALSVASGIAIVFVVHFFGRAIFGPSFDGLTQVVIVLVVAQLVADQWSLRVLADSASETVQNLVWASAAGIVVLAVIVAILVYTSSLSALTMATAMLLFAIARLSVWRGLRRARAHRS
ncbi:lipopolysaccharide biosynthesis protein [Frigoribacterium sp. Leaf164]|uniref:lipopolysaccharide biosynthesis protein n=1 Tax=Frigoribacterium sp. Leaf164 TaxID=1736282 RepID=UPI001F23FABF|nr:hypothetical protein [Frigoribacterium sp. Leaf164]